MTGRRRLALLGAGLAAVLAVVWTVVVPDEAIGADGVRAVALRWGHPVSWAALSVMGLLVAADAPGWSRRLAGGVALTAYAGFVAALVL